MGSTREGADGGNTTRPSAAADLLLHDWPEFQGPAYERAKVTIMKALEEPEDAALNEVSRLAFEEAACEAGILIG